MIYKKIYLKNFYKNLKHNAVLEIFVPHIKFYPSKVDPVRPCMLVIPGGAYLYPSEREGDPVVINFLNKKFVSACLYYTCKKDIKKERLYPTPQLETLAAIDYLRKHSNELCIDPNCISLVGFSAGGHLAGSIGYLYKTLAKNLNLKPKEVKPNALILSYPVISFKEKSGTRLNLIDDDKKYFEKLSINLNIAKDYPPTFIWTTKNDKVVPYENSVLMNKALTKSKVKHEFVLFPNGPHGLSTVDCNNVAKESDLVEFSDVRTWIDKSTIFVKKIFQK